MRNDLNLYTLKERIFLIKAFYKSDSDVDCVKSNYLYEYGELEDVPTETLIFEVVNLFEETGSVREIPSVLIKKEEDSSLAYIDCDTIVTEIKVEQSEVKEDSFDDEQQPNDYHKVSDFLLDDNLLIIAKGPVKRKKTLKKPSKKRKIKSEDDNKKVFTCAICEKSCNTLYGMRLHIGGHKSKPPKTCRFCKLVIPSRYLLRKHIKSNHSDEVQKEKPLPTCPVCSKTFTQGSILRKHMQKHSEEVSEVCEICGKGFKRKDSVAKHMTIHTGEKNFKCDYPNCNRAFRARNSYEIHMRSHTNEKPYICQTCGKGFKDQSSRRVHQLQHTGESPYACELCGKTTKQKQNLKSHMRHVHKIN